MHRCELCPVPAQYRYESPSRNSNYETACKGSAKTSPSMSAGNSEERRGHQWHQDIS